MKRRKFIEKGCLCSGLLFTGLIPDNITDLTGAKAIQKTAQSNPIVAIDQRQIQNVFCYIDSSMNESVKKTVFERLGFEHTTNEGFIKRMNEYKGNIKSYFDMVNSNKSTYWEKLEYNPDISAIKVIGRVVDRCACPFAQCENAPKSLCNYCCVSFQKHMFEMLLEKPVKVQVDEAFLLGDKRCSTTIFVDEKLPLERI